MWTQQQVKPDPKHNQTNADGRCDGGLIHADVLRADLLLPNRTSASSRRAPSFVLKSSLWRVIEFWLWLLKSCHYCYTSSRYKKALIRMKAAPLPRWLCWYCRNPPVRLARGFFKNNKGTPSDFFQLCSVKHMNDEPRTLEVYIQTWDALQPSVELLCSFNIFHSFFIFMYTYIHTSCFSSAVCTPENYF